MPELCSTKISVDRVVKAKWVIPVTETTGRLKVIRDGCVASTENQIVFVGTQVDFDKAYLADDVLDRTDGDHVIMPAFYNMHSHIGMHLMKGKFDDYLLHDWLAKLWPVEQHYLGDAVRKERYCYMNSLLGCYESALEGVVFVNDMYFSPNAAEKAASEVGIRVLSGQSIMDFQDGGIDDWMKKEYSDLRSGKSKVLCLHGLYTSGKEVHDAFAKWRTEFKDHLFHIHMNESKAEREMQLKVYPDIDVVKKIDQMGCLDKRLIAAHMVHCTDAEIELCGKRKINVAHCPRSNMKLASGMADTQKMIDCGVNVCLGTDSAASNNALSMIDEMASACFVGKFSCGRADGVPADEAIRMATINGAKALGLSRKQGNLVPGKLADITVINLTPDNHWHPVTTDPVSHVVFGHRRKVVDTICEGKLIVKGGQLLTHKLDKKAMTSFMEEIDKRIFERANVRSDIQQGL